MTHPQKPLILTHRDVDGVCAGAIAKASYPKAEIKFANPPDFVSMLNSLFRYDCVIILDLGIDSIQKNEAIEAFQKLSKTSSIVYIDHHIRPSGLTDRNLACKEAYRTDASTSELAWEFFKPAASLDYIAVLGAIGDYKERTPQIQGLLERYDERKVYPEALFLEWALMVSEDSFKRGVIEELVQGKWPYQMSIMGKEADAIVRRQRTLERYVREKAEKICEHVMLIRDPPFKATGPAATLLTKLDNVDIGIASRTDESHVYLSLRRHEESDINLASLIDKSASKLGGMGGGHLAASGGKIPVERFDEFLVEIRRVLRKGRLKRINRLDVGSVDKKKIERKLFKETIERRRAEERAERLRKYLELQIDRMPLGSIVWDRDFRVTTWNPAAQKIFGFTEEEALGKHPYDFIVPKEAQPHVDDVWRRLLEGDSTAHSVNENVTKDGRTIICDWANTPLKEADGTVIGVLSMVQDITERKRVEDEIRRRSALSAAINKLLKGTLRCETDEEAGKICLSMAEELTESKFGIIYEVNERGLADSIAISRPGWTACMMPRSKAAKLLKNKKIGSYWGRIIKEGKSQIVNDPASDPDQHGAPKGHPPITSFLGVPLKRAGKTIGLIGLANKKSGYTLADQQIIEALSSAFVEFLDRKRAEKALKESEGRFKTLFEEAPDSMHIHSLDGKFIDGNKAAEELLGYKRGELIGKNMLKVGLLSKKSIPRFTKMLTKSNTGKRTGPDEIELVRKDGKKVLVEINSLPISIGGKRSVLAITRDITERKRAEEWRRRLATVVQDSNDAITVQDFDGNILAWNQGAVRMYGWSEPEAIAMKIVNIIPKGKRDEAVAFVQKLRAGEAVEPFETQRVTKDGRTLHVWLTLTKLADNDGAMVAIATTERDITEQKRAEKELKESNEKLSLILDNTNDIIVYVDKHGRIQDVNKKVEDLLGYNRDELVGKNFAKIGIIGITHISKMVKLFTSEIRGKLVSTVELEIKDKNGNKIPVEASTKIIKKNGKMEGIVSILRDTSERNMAENKVKMEREAYHSIARAANQSRTVEELCELALNGIQKVIKYDLADVMIYRESEDALSSVAQIGFPRDLYERTVKWLDLKDGSTIAAQAALKRKGIYIDDVKTSKLMSRLHDLIVKYDISTMYSVPLFSRGKLQGVLEVITVGDKVLSKDDCEVLNTISEELAGGIAKAKSEEHLVTVKEAFGWLGMPTNRAPSPNPHL